MEVTFKRAFDHCRSTRVLKDAIEKYIMPYQYHNQTFETIVVYVDSIFKNIKGLGLLTTVDVTKCICDAFNIEIDRIYLIGSGPKMTLKNLGKEDLIKIHNIGNLKLPYIEKSYAFCG